MFYLANFHSKISGLQYIITANQKELDAIKSEFSKEEYQEYIDQNFFTSVIHHTNNDGW